MMILERKINLNIEQILLDMKNSLPEDFIPNERTQMVKEMLIMQQLYNAAIREISTKLETLDEEFQVLYSHNPIHHVESRLKSPSSIAAKLIKRGLPLSPLSAMDNLTDIAGIRVICHYINDIYVIEELLSKQKDLVIIKKTDYIESPKPNGYRSLHLIIGVPVYLSNKIEYVSVEIQIRTIAMDFWASLEHNLRYKSQNVPDELRNRLTICADSISKIDSEMQEIYKELNRRE